MSSFFRSSEGRLRADKRKSLTILVLGDEGVGKSSLISSFVSRHFADVVPGIMTRIRLPRDERTGVYTNIIDSQGGDVALLASMPTVSSSSSLLQSRSASSSSLSGIGTVDSIVLVYDLDRFETFFRLENHWLPLIERCYNGKVPVIVAGNKDDLFQPSRTIGVTDEQALARSRQQIVSLLQRFRFVRQHIKCSAKRLQRVNEVFRKAQAAVLYPITPLMVLETGKLTPGARKALTRIFRVYDKDNDGLLSDQEMERFQDDCFEVSLGERDFKGWKKTIQRVNPDEETVSQGKFTLAGFYTLFDIFIGQNRLDTPWTVLRKFGYDDELQLHIPEAIVRGTSRSGSGTSGPLATVQQQQQPYWTLSPSTLKFLTDLFHRYAGENKQLTPEQVEEIFSILPDPALPPWHPYRASQVFQGCFSLPKEPQSTVSSPNSSSMGTAPHDAAASSSMNEPLSFSTSGITIVSGESLPTVSGHSHPSSEPMGYWDWIGHWHTMSAISPSMTRIELFRLGHADHAFRKQDARRHKLAPSRQVRILVLGSPASGKTSLLNCLEGSKSDDPTDTVPTTQPTTNGVHVRRTVSKDASTEECVTHLIFTEVPQANDRTREIEERVLPKGTDFDLVLFVFDCTQASSLSFVKNLESTLLSDDMPRAYIATKSDLMKGEESVLEDAKKHCEELDLESPWLMSSVTDASDNYAMVAAQQKRSETLQRLTRFAVGNDECGTDDRLKSRPYEQKRRETARRRKYWLTGGFVTATVAVAVGVVYLCRGRQSGKKGSGFGWFQSLRSILSAVATKTS